MHCLKLSVSFYIISENGLGQRCADILLKYGHELKGVVSKHPRLVNWALNHKIPVFNTVEDLQSIQPHQTFDYLLSIVNSEILPPEVLFYPRKLAINYHDSPLPRYAGVHATSWAILNNEKTHGVTWHVMEPRVDGGDILKQTFFTIDSNETALSLNLKCFSHAVQTFEELILDLSEENTQRTPQNFQDRTYYAAHQKPEAIGFIDWEQSAQDIERLYRALYFGHYPNHLTSIKTILKGWVITPNRITLLGHKSEDVKPGTIIDVTSQGLRVATQTEDILIESLTDMQGRLWKGGKLEQDLKIKNGVCFTSLNKIESKACKKLLADISPHEDYWHQKLVTADPLSLPYINATSDTAKYNYTDPSAHPTFHATKKIDLQKIRRLAQKLGTSSLSDVLVGIMGLYFLKLSNQSDQIVRFDYITRNLVKSNLHSPPGISPSIRISLNPDYVTNDIQTAFKKVFSELASSQNNKTFAYDIAVRNLESDARIKIFIIHLFLLAH